MSRISLGLLAAASTLALAAAPASAQELRIGFLNTTTGQGALIGKFIANGWALGLEHAGWKKDGDPLGGVPTRIFDGDDQSRPDVGIREVDRLIKSEKVQIIAGQIWSNVMMATQKPIFDSKVMLLATNAGPSPMAGELCNPLFVSTGAQNDLAAEATGELATKDGIKSFIALAPNYQAGKDYVGGFERGYKGGQVLDRVFFKIGETDFQSEFSQVRARKPEAIMVFAPGAMGVSFMKQWQASGLKDSIKVYAVYSLDYMTLPPIGEAAIGAVEASHWNPESGIPKNQRFVKDYVAKFGAMPSFTSAATYDAVDMLAKAMQATKGTGDSAAIARSIRTATHDTVRGTLKHNVNGFLLQPYWRMDIVAGPGGKPFIKGGAKVLERSDSFAEKCPADKRI